MPRLPKTAIASVIRRCAVAIGHPPDAAELAAWANGNNEGTLRPFGRAISEKEAALMLKHQDRIVSARSAAPHEIYVEPDDLPDNVVSLAVARAERASKRQRRH